MSIFFKSPICIVLLVATALSLAAPAWSHYSKRRRNTPDLDGDTGG